MMATGLTDPAKFTVKVRYPQILATEFLSIGAGDCPVFVGQRAGICVGQFKGILYTGLRGWGCGNGRRFAYRFSVFPAEYLVIGGGERGGQSFDQDRVLARNFLHHLSHLFLLSFQHIIAKGVPEFFSGGVQGFEHAFPWHDVTAETIQGHFSVLPGALSQ